MSKAYLFVVPLLAIGLLGILDLFPDEYYDNVRRVSVVAELRGRCAEYDYHNQVIVIKGVKRCLNVHVVAHELTHARTGIYTHNQRFEEALKETFMGMFFSRR